MYRQLVSMMAAAGGGGGSYDSDAQAYFTAAGISSTTIKDAWNQCVLDLKAASIWTKMHAVYPMPGSTAAINAVNAKNPGTFDITWGLGTPGGLTHNSNGVSSTGSEWGTTGYNPSTSGAAHNNHISVYSRSTNSGGSDRMEIGASNGSNGHIYMGCGVAFVSGNAYTNNGDNKTINVSAGSGQGFFISSRRANNDLELYRNGTSIGTNTSTSSGVAPNLAMFIMAVNASGSVAFPTNKNVAFASIGEALTDTEAGDFYTAVQAFQTALGRQI